jgi:hypothetical protein
MKNAVFWDVAPCRYFVNRRFGGMYRLHHQGKNPRVMMEAIHSSETSVNKISTRRHIPEVAILHIHRRENLKSHNDELV